MIITIENLIKALDNLPDPEKYPYSEYRLVIRSSEPVTPWVEPNRNHHPFVELSILKRRSTEGKMIWTIEL